jgi:DNA-binding SARP family transcriptional activator
VAQEPSAEVRRKTAEYAQRPGVWHPPAPPAQLSIRSVLSTVGRVVRGLVGALLFLGVPPVALWRLWGNPIELLPSWQQAWEWVTETGDTPNTPREILPTALLLVVWLMWATAALLLIGSLIVEVTRRRVRLPSLPAPLHRLVFGLAGTAAVTLTATVRPSAEPSATAPAVTVPAAEEVSESGAPPGSTPARGPAIIHVGAASYTYVVERHDTLSKIARRWLGDPDRWPEICGLNRHRHFPTVGGTLRDCDLIYPGWDLTLPPDAQPPAGAVPRRPPATPKPPPADPAPSPAQPSPTVSEDPDGVAEPAAPGPPTSKAAEPEPSSPAYGSPQDTTATDNGVTLPGGGFIPWALAAAITAAAAMVWLQRRRRFTPGDTSADMAELPEPVREVQRQVTRHHQPPSDLAERAAAVPVQALLPAGGIGVVGDGAHAAARGALVAALASGGPHDPDRQGEVVIDHATFSQLFGTDTTLTSWPRLHIADDIDHALTLLDARLLHRARILDEHALTDVNTLRENAPTEEALPPVLSITAEGHTRVIDGPAVEAMDDRVAVLDTPAAVAILTTLREAHTGEPPNPTLRPSLAPQPPAPATTQAAIPPIPANEPAGSADEPSTAESPLDAPPQPADAKPPVKVKLRVLGAPDVEDITLPGRSLRGRAAELAVYLACHPDGADTDTIAEYLVPEVRRRQAKQLVHTNASNLRHVFGRAGGPITGGYVLKRGASARYRLDPTTVAVDLWQLRDLLTRAQLASAPVRTELLREACDLYTAPLAEGCDYEWVDPHREKARQWGTEAHLLLADDLLESDPQAASDLLDKAIGLDRYNEELYRKAMHARHALRDADGIRALLRALAKALADLDTEPAEATTDLAAKLRASLEQR